MALIQLLCLQRFTGHGTSVSSLLFIGDNLLLSSAIDDRILNLWYTYLY